MAQHIVCGTSSLVDLADDILMVIGRCLSPRDICNLSICCKSLSARVVYDEIWLSKCEDLEILSYMDLVEWRKAVLSYKGLCRFLTIVKPLLGIWVHQKPELGNVVYVMPGFASVVGCRIIPQRIRPSGLDNGPILWAPVFEVISDDNGSPAFVLHGREKGHDYIYPGTVKSIEKSCNVLLLEILRKTLQNAVTVPFSTLSFVDQENLLEVVSRGVRIPVPDSVHALLFPCLRDHEDRFRKDVSLLSERRMILIEMHKQYFPSDSGTTENILSRGENKDAEVHDFLTLQALTKELSYYRAWPQMDESLLALYKLPIQESTVDQEYAGLWGGTFGWPPGKQTDYKHGKALFFVVLSYEKESPDQRLLIATKILDGTEYVLYPNGSAMFTVNVDTPSNASFPWKSGADSLPIGVEQAFVGEGIADGYSFRYPGSEPGTLFAFENGILAFLWNEPGSVLTLQRINLEELLKKGRRVPALPPVAII